MKWKEESYLTRDGVCHNLYKSPYYMDYAGLRFFFSSKLHLDRFRKDVLTKIDWINDSFQRRFHIGVQCDVIACLQLYYQVEKRGYLVQNLKNFQYYTSGNDINVRASVVD